MRYINSLIYLLTAATKWRRQLIRNGPFTLPWTELAVRRSEHVQIYRSAGCVAQRWNVGLWPTNFPVLRSTCS